MSSHGTLDLLLHELAVVLAAQLIPLIREELSGDCSTEDRQRSEEQRQSSAVYLTTAQVATALKVSPKTVRRWITSGNLEAITLGREYRIPVTALEAFRGTGESSSDPTGRTIDDLVASALSRTRTEVKT